MTDDGRTDDGPLVYYKLILWAFGSGELKTTNKSNVFFFFFFFFFVGILVPFFSKWNIFIAWTLYNSNIFFYNNAVKKIKSFK